MALDPLPASEIQIAGEYIVTHGQHRATTGLARSPSTKGTSIKPCARRLYAPATQ